MLKILNAAQHKQLDLYTIQSEPISSLDLMERAATAFVQWFVQQFKANQKIGVICGTGNNGGDGLAIARLLKNWSYPVKVWIVKGGKESEDFSANQERLGDVSSKELTDSIADSEFSECTILIDALFGTGLSRPLEGFYSKVVDSINQTNATILSVDMPSGLQLETSSSGSIIRAHFTITFQTPKLAFFLPENSQFVGQWHCLDIGLSKARLKELETNHYLIDRSSIRSRLKQRKVFDHKGINGKALLVAGSYGKVGACILSARAALRSGLGLLTAHVPALGNGIIQTAVPEAMVSTDSNNQSLSYVGDASGFNAIGVGPGLGQAKETINGLSKLLEQTCPMVIDADALNIISLHRELLFKIPEGSILTPHPKEFERLVGKWKNDFERLQKQKELAQQIKSVVVLKGAYSSIVDKSGRIYFNSTGNPGMAKGGTGDVLTGILLSLLAQGYTALDSALIGVYVHGLAGDKAAHAKGMDSLIASDLIDFLPEAFLKLRS